MCLISSCRFIKSISELLSRVRRPAQFCVCVTGTNPFFFPRSLSQTVDRGGGAAPAGDANNPKLASLFTLKCSVLRRTRTERASADFSRRQSAFFSRRAGSQRVHLSFLGELFQQPLERAGPLRHTATHLHQIPHFRQGLCLFRLRFKYRCRPCDQITKIYAVPCKSF